MLHSALFHENILTKELVQTLYEYEAFFFSFQHNIFRSKKGDLLMAFGERKRMDQNNGPM